MDALPMVLGLWLAVPVPLGTEFSHNGEDLKVTVVLTRPEKRNIPVQYAAGRQVQWAWQRDFDDDFGNVRYDRLYAVETKDGPLLYPGYLIQLHR